MAGISLLVFSFAAKAVFMTLWWTKIH